MKKNTMKASEEDKFRISMGLRIYDCRVKKFGDAHGSAARCGRELGMKRASWNAVETGKHVLGSDRVVAFAKFFDVDPAWLLTGEGTPDKKDSGGQPEPASMLEKFTSVFSLRLAAPPKVCPNGSACLRQAKILKLIAGSVATLGLPERFEEFVDLVTAELLEESAAHRAKHTNDESASKKKVHP